MGEFVGVQLPASPLTPITVSNVVFSIKEFEPSFLKDNIRLGRLLHGDKVNISRPYNLPITSWTSFDYAAGHLSAQKFDSGLNVTANGANLSIDISEGYCTRIGAAVDIDSLEPIDVNTPYSAQQLTQIIRPVWRGDAAGTYSVYGTPTTLIDPTKYDNGSGTLQTAAPNTFTNIYIYFFPYRNEETVFHLYGHNDYGSLALAQTAAGTKDDLLIPDDLVSGSLLACVSVKENTTNLTAAISGGDASILSFDKYSRIIK